MRATILCGRQDNRITSMLTFHHTNSHRVMRPSTTAKTNGESGFGISMMTHTAMMPHSSQSDVSDDIDGSFDGSIPFLEDGHMTSDGYGGGHARRSIVRRMLPVLRLLQLCSYYPSVVQSHKCSSTTPNGVTASRPPTSPASPLLVRLMLKWTALAIILANVALFSYTVKISMRFCKTFGLMHAISISSVITGLKPLVNVAAMLVFFLNLSEHHCLLKRLDKIDLSFHAYFGTTPRVERMNVVFIVLAGFFFFVPLTLRVIESIIMRERLGAQLMSGLSFILVPCLSLWNVAPLFYYAYVTGLARFWCTELRCAIKQHRRLQLQQQKQSQATDFGPTAHPYSMMLQNQQTTNYDLSFFYGQFLQITKLQQAIGGLFNPFILFSLGWTLFTLCLSIYFGTQASQTVDDPPRMFLGRPRLLEQWFLLIRCNIGWSVLQIVVAGMHIVIICSNGTRTNEATRRILSTVLNAASKTGGSFDQFQVQNFVHKTNTQHTWGMTVWRAFPLERTTFFTIVSGVMTYAFLLMKLKTNSNLGSIGGDGQLTRSVTQLPSTTAQMFSNTSQLLANATGLPPAADNGTPFFF